MSAVTVACDPATLRAISWIIPVVVTIESPSVSLAASPAHPAPRSASVMRSSVLIMASIDCADRRRMRRARVRSASESQGPEVIANALTQRAPPSTHLAPAELALDRTVERARAEHPLRDL